MNSLFQTPYSIRRIIILLMLFSFAGKSQFLFNKRINCGGYDGAYSVLVNGNNFSIYGFKYYNYGTRYDYRYLTLNIDNIGDTIHTQSYGKIKYDFYSGSWGGVCCFNNQIYDFGTREDTLNHIESILYKFNINGDTVFTKVSNDTSFQYGFDTKITRKKNLILLGASDTIDPNFDYSLMLTDTLGSIKFKKHYGTSYPENGCAVDTCLDRGYIIGGWRQLSGANNYITYVVKTDSLGGLQWQNTYGNYKGVFIYSCKKGGYLIAAMYVDSLVGIDAYTRPNLIKINDNGGVVWDKKYGVSGYGTDVVVSYELANGDIISCGTIQHINPVTSTYNYGLYGLIMRTDSLGNLKFYQTYQADTFNGAQNYLYDIKPLSDGGFIAVGFVQPNDGTTQDVWVLRVDSNGCDVSGCSTATGIMQYSNNIELKAFPNPFNNELNVIITLPNDINEAQLQLIEPATGRILIEKTIIRNQKETTFSTTNLSAGMYLIGVKGGNISPQYLKVVNVK
jgi:type IX secretion system substrate protein